MRNKLILIFLSIFFSSPSIAENVTIEAKNIALDKDRVTSVFENEVVIKTKEKIIKSNYAKYNKKIGLLIIKDDVVATDIQNNIIQTEYAEYTENNKILFSKGPTKIITPDSYILIGEDITVDTANKRIFSNKDSILKDLDGNKIFFKNFDYSTNTNIFKSIGLIKLNDKADNSYEFSQTYIDTKKKEILGTDLKVYLNQDDFKINEKNNPRIFANSGNITKEKSSFRKSIFTICQYRKNDKCPPWSIQSRKMLHDNKKKTIYYDHAIVKVYDIPIFYFPKFSHPDPTVDRQSGFLRPQINRSKILGTSFYLPYYHVISNDKDFTFKPQIFDSEIEMFQSEYRQANKNSNFIADFGITRGYQSSITGSERNSIGHFFSKFNKNLNLNNYTSSKFNVYFESVTNDTFLNVFKNNLIKSSVKPKDYNQLNSGFEVLLDHEKFSFDTGFQIYETLSGKESDRYQYNFPYYDYTTSIIPNLFNGTFELSSSGSNVLNNTNNLKTTINNNLSYSSIDYFSDLGFKNSYGFYLKNLNTVAKNDTVYKSSLSSQLMSIFEARSTYPLIKSSNEFDETISPTISFRLNPGQMKNLTSRDINVDNIFSINRLGLSEAYEKGKSLTLGLNYRKQKKLETINEKLDDLEDIEKYFEIKFAGVLRDVEEDKISTSTTLNRKASNLFGSITNKMSEKIQIDYNFAIDNDFSTFEKNSVDLKFSVNNLITNFGFSEENGEMGDSNVLSNTTLYKFDDNNYLSFGTRRNRKINLTEYYDLVYEYKNDCLTAGVKYRKTYYSDRDAKPTEDLLLTLTLFPLVTLEQDVEQNFYRENDLFN